MSSDGIASNLRTNPQVIITRRSAQNVLGDARKIRWTSRAEWLWRLARKMHSVTGAVNMLATCAHIVRPRARNGFGVCAGIVLLAGIAPPRAQIVGRRAQVTLDCMRMRFSDPRRGLDADRHAVRGYGGDQSVRRRFRQSGSQDFAGLSTPWGGRDFSGWRLGRRLEFFTVRACRLMKLRHSRVARRASALIGRGGRVR